MKKFFEEFKAFAMRGNVIDLAIGVVIGGAFNAIVSSLVNDIISPLIGLIFNMDFSEVGLAIGDVTVGFGSFINAVINFLIVAFSLFMVVKAMNAADAVRKAAQKKEEEKPAPAAPTEKDCPYCFSKIPVKATRCPHCTSQLEG